MRRWLILAFMLAATVAVSQTVLNPAPSAAVCAYNTVAPTAAASGFLQVQCNSLGQLVIQ
jgi:hypothetical protein